VLIASLERADGAALVAPAYSHAQRRGEGVFARKRCGARATGGVVKTAREGQPKPTRDLGKEHERTADPDANSNANRNVEKAATCSLHGLAARDVAGPDRSPIAQASESPTVPGGAK
jgi:hypothetical protein